MSGSRNRSTRSMAETSRLTCGSERSRWYGVGCTLSTGSAAKSTAWPPSGSRYSGEHPSAVRLHLGGERAGRVGDVLPGVGWRESALGRRRLAAARGLALPGNLSGGPGGGGHGRGVGDCRARGLRVEELPCGCRPSSLVLAGLAAVVAGVLLLRPAPDSPERQVRAAVEAMARAAREHDPAGVLDHVSEGFTSPELGRKPELRAYLLGELLRGGVVEARVLEARTEATARRRGALHRATAARADRGRGGPRAAGGGGDVRRRAADLARGAGARRAGP